MFDIEDKSNLDFPLFDGEFDKKESEIKEYNEEFNEE